MKALLLVGGSGTRLRPFTNFLPKPMIPIMGRPLLQRTCERLRDCGVDEVVMNPCYMADKIVDHFKDGGEHRLKITYEMEETPLGTGGTIKNTQRHYDDSFFVLNADILHDISLKDMMAYHKRMKADVTIAATYVEDPTPYGIINYDENGYITAFKEKPKPEEVTSHYINAGVYIFEPEVLESIPAGRPVSVEREVFPALLKAGKTLAVYRDKGYWMDIGTPQKYVQAHIDILEGRCNITEHDFRFATLAGEKTVTAENAFMALPPSYLGQRVHIGAQSSFGPYCVLGDDVEIGRGCRLDNCIIWPGVHLHDGSRMKDCVVAGAGNIYTVYTFEELGIQNLRKRSFREYVEQQKANGFVSEYLPPKGVRDSDLHPGHRGPDARWGKGYSEGHRH